MSVYDYDNPLEFLRDKLKEKQKINAYFSIRAWSKQLGFKSHTPLYETIKGKRKISQRLIPAFIKAFKLNSNEGYYFETLVGLYQAKTDEEKEFYSNRLVRLRPQEIIHFDEIECYEYLRNPIHFFILEMIELVDFKNDPKWIKERLIINYSTEEIKNAIERLITLGLVQSENGRLKKTYRFLTSPPDITDQAVQELHQNFSKISQEQVSNLPVQDREYHSYVMSASKESMPNAKKAIRDFIATLGETIGCQEDGAEEIYQFNLCFFKTTKS